VLLAVEFVEVLRGKFAENWTGTKTLVRRKVTLLCLHWGTCCAFILNLVNEKGLPVWKLAYSFSVYIILPENTQVPQCKQRRVTYLLTYIMSEIRHG
jgi:hypothetical protein